MKQPVQIPQRPELNTCLKANYPSSETLQLLSQRRSSPIKCLSGPGPSKEDIEAILSIATRVPDHRKLEPWRMVIISGDARISLGKKLGSIYEQENPNCTSEDIKVETNRFLRTPICIAVISSPDIHHKTPVWEQELSTGALCMNILTTANASGWAGSWITEWYAFSQAFKKTMHLEDHERFAGFIYLGTAMQDPPERPRPDLSKVISYWPY